MALFEVREGGLLTDERVCGCDVLDEIAGLLDDHMPSISRADPALLHLREMRQGIEPLRLALAELPEPRHRRRSSPRLARDSPLTP